MVSAGSIGARRGPCRTFRAASGRLSDPLIDLALFRIPAFTGSLLVNLASVMFMFGTFIFVANTFSS